MAPRHKAANRMPQIVIARTRTRAATSDSWWLNHGRDGFTSTARKVFEPQTSSSPGITHEPWPTQRSPEAQARISRQGAQARVNTVNERIRMRKKVADRRSAMVKGTKRPKKRPGKCFEDPFAGPMDVGGNK